MEGVFAGPTPPYLLLQVLESSITQRGQTLSQPHARRRTAASTRSALRFITTQPFPKPPLADHKMQPLLSRGARPLAKHARAMSGKEIHFGTEGRALMLRGVDQLADAVSVTLGPKGRNAILDQPYGAPKITKDGVTVRAPRPESRVDGVEATRVHLTMKWVV